MADEHDVPDVPVVPADEPTSALSTALIHHPYRAPLEWDAIPVGVHKASTVFFPNVKALRERRWVDKSAYTYGLKGTPTSFTLEARLSAIEGAEHVMLVPSGLAAITLVDLALLKSGDELLLPDNVYGPSLALAQHELARWGIAYRFYDPLDATSLAAAITPATRLIWLEAAGSVTMEFPDLRGLIRTARALAPQARIAIDHTWGSGLAFNPFALGEAGEPGVNADDLGVDIAVHALTKYPSGGGDVLMGSVACRDESLRDQLAWTHSRLGYGVGADDVAAVLRGLPTLELRYRAQDLAARRIAAWAQTRPEFVRVLHPSLPASPGHAHWASLCTQAAGLVTVEVDGAIASARVDAFVDALRLFRIGWSWAGPVSLVAPYNPATLRQRPCVYKGQLVRLCVGLENVDDLIADLTQALGALKAASA